MVRGRITRDATVRITGYTDRLGEEQFNRELSSTRAREVAQALDVKVASVRGAGESPELHDNALPEGRFYCRTVNVIVEIPVAGRAAER
jgi:outer membrane protein OmpA-like peptidoglycan-associated protein